MMWIIIYTYFLCPFKWLV